MTHNKKATVPWQEIESNTSKFIHSQYLPKDVQFQDPSKMQFGEVKAFCNFLCNRQTLGQPVFQFQYVLPKHQRGKLAMHKAHLPRDDDDSDPESISSIKEVTSLCVEQGEKGQTPALSIEYVISLDTLPMSE
jgi:hypothetical protein